MDAILYMSDMLSDMRKLFDLTDPNLARLWEFMKSPYFKELPVHKQQALLMIIRETAPKVGNLIGEFVEHGRKESSSSQNDLVKEYREKIKYLIGGMMDKVFHLTDNTLVVDKDQLFKLIENRLHEMDKIIQKNKVKNIENLLLEEADISNRITLNMRESSALFLKKVFPDVFSMQNDHERPTLFYKFIMELGRVMVMIDTACEEQPLAVLLIGGLLSLKPIANNIWKRVKDDMDKITWPNNKIRTNHMGQIFTYCYNDLPYFLQSCFLYFACYPIGFEIPATSLTQMWIAEGFVEEEDKQTSLETTANKYLDELVQRYAQYFKKLTFGLIIYR